MQKVVTLQFAHNMFFVEQFDVWFYKEALCDCDEYKKLYDIADPQLLCWIG